MSTETRRLESRRRRCRVPPRLSGLLGRNEALLLLAPDVLLEARPGGLVFQEPRGLVVGF